MPSRMYVAELYGRAREEAALLRHLREPGVVTLRGPPGVGKSALARKVAEVSGLRVVRASLAGRDTTHAIVEALPQAMRLRHDEGGSVTSLVGVARALEGGDSLLLLDDADEGALRDVVGALLALADLRILVCAQGAIGHPAETVEPLGPLATGDAVALLRDRVARAGATLDEVDAEALVVRASGLPLVIELLAPQVAAAGARATLSALAAEGLDGMTLDRAFSRAFGRLRSSERAALAALSILRGPFTVERAAALIGGEGAFQDFHALCRGSWVARAGTSADTFELLPSVRDFGRRTAPPDLASRHAAMMIATLPPIQDLAATGVPLPDRDDLMAAWRHAVATGASTAVSTLALALDVVLVRTGPLEEHRTMLRTTLDMPGIVAEERVRLWIALGRLYAIRGRHKRAVACFDAAHALLADPEAPGRWASTTAACLAFSLRPIGRLAEAREAVARALRCGEGDLLLLATAEQMQGTVAHTAGDPGEAEAAFGRAAALARLAGSQRVEAIADANLLLVHLGTANLPRAEEALERCRAGFARTEDRFHLGRILRLEGELRLRQGRVDEAERDLRESWRVAAAEQDVDTELASRALLVEVAITRGQAAQAAAGFEELVALARVVDDTSWPERIARLRTRIAAHPPREVVLGLDPEGRMVTLDQRTLDFGRRGPLRRVLVALARARLAGVTLTSAEVLDAGWPGERMLPESGAARVYMAIRRLRELGLDGTLLTRDGGYLLAAHCRVRFVTPEM